MKTEGQSSAYTKTFHSGNEYMIIAFSDDSDVEDVDLYLNYSNGMQLENAISSDALEVIQYSPVSTRAMQVKFVNHESFTPSYAPKCRLLIGYK